MKSNKIAQRIKEVRNKLGWSQRKLSKESGVNPATISAIEIEERNPKISTVESIANAFKMSVSELMGESVVGDSEKAEFFSQWGDINKLDESDVVMVRSVIDRFLKADLKIEKCSFGSFQKEAIEVCLPNCSVPLKKVC